MRNMKEIGNCADQNEKENLIQVKALKILEESRNTLVAQDVSAAGVARCVAKFQNTEPELTAEMPQFKEWYSLVGNWLITVFTDKLEEGSEGMDIIRKAAGENMSLLVLIPLMMMMMMKILIS